MYNTTDNIQLTNDLPPSYEEAVRVSYAKEHSNFKRYSSYADIKTLKLEVSRYSISTFTESLKKLFKAVCEFFRDIFSIDVNNKRRSSFKKDRQMLRTSYITNKNMFLTNMDRINLVFYEIGE